MERVCRLFILESTIKNLRLSMDTLYQHSHYLTAKLKKRCESLVHFTRCDVVYGLSLTIVDAETVFSVFKYNTSIFRRLFSYNVVFIAINYIINIKSFNLLYTITFVFWYMVQPLILQILQKFKEYKIIIFVLCTVLIIKLVYLVWYMLLTFLSVERLLSTDDLSSSSKQLHLAC